MNDERDRARIRWGLTRQFEFAGEGLEYLRQFIDATDAEFEERGMLPIADEAFYDFVPVYLGKNILGIVAGRVETAPDAGEPPLKRTVEFVFYEGGNEPDALHSFYKGEGREYPIDDSLELLRREVPDIIFQLKMCAKYITNTSFN